MKKKFTQRRGAAKENTPPLLCILNSTNPSDSKRSPFQAWLGIEASTKRKVYLQVFAAARIDSLSYWLEIFFSAGIATFGLVESSPAVIIGAMLISPLMGPIMGTGLALAVGDLYLGMKAVLNLVASIAVSIAFSGFLVWLLPFHSATPEILARVNPNLLDLGIALLSGLAGSVVVSRGSGEGVTALPGVAIAVALMPPLCAMGFGLGSGVNLEIMGGAGLLFLTNLVAIVASAFVVFLLVGLDTPEVQTVMLASREDEQLAADALARPGQAGILHRRAAALARPGYRHPAGLDRGAFAARAASSGQRNARPGSGTGRTEAPGAARDAWCRSN